MLSRKNSPIEDPCSKLQGMRSFSRFISELQERIARPIRLGYPGWWYYLTCRQNERKEIFSDGLDRVKFLEIPARSAELSGIEVHAYVLMDNLFYLLDK